jgi:biotin carboxyl carrier protein
VTALSPDDDHFELKIEEKIYRVKMLSFNLMTRECSLQINGQPVQARILRPIDLKIESMGLNKGISKKQDIIHAPMPGLVKAIKTEPGANVEKGDPLLILEAMKMENVITAQHAGIIKEVKVTLGQAVERGLPLVEFESD